MKNKLILTLLLVVLYQNLFAFGPFGHIVLCDQVAKSLPQNSIIRQCMEAYPKVARWGAEGPDSPAANLELTNMSLFHYFKAGSFAKQLMQDALLPVVINKKTFLQLTEDEKAKIAWAAGWMTHIAGDFGSHSTFVAPEAGFFIENEAGRDLHKELEGYADSYLFYKFELEKQIPLTREVLKLGAPMNSYTDYALLNLLSKPIFSEKPTLESIKNNINSLLGLNGLRNSLNFGNDVAKKIYNNNHDFKVYTSSFFSFAWINLNILTKTEIAQILIDKGSNTINARENRINKAFEMALNFGNQFLSEAENNTYTSYSDNWNLDVGENAKYTYTIKVKTAQNEASFNNIDPGTGDHVYLILMNKKNEILQLEIDEEYDNVLDQNVTQYFHVYTSNTDFAPINIRKVALRKARRLVVDDGWRLEYFTIYVEGEEVLKQSPNMWLQECASETPFYKVKNLVPPSWYK